MINVKDILIFVAGVAVGGGVAWKVASDKYKKIADEEIESVKEVFESRHHIVNNVVQVKPVTKKDDIQQEIIQNNEYIVTDNEEENDEDSDLLIDVEQDPDKESVEPYTIAPEEYGEMPGYDTKTLYYYADKVLAYEDGELEVDPISVIGRVKLEGAFGEYSDDGVYIRNDNLKCDYEILLSLKTYDEDTGKMIEES